MHTKHILFQIYSRKLTASHTSLRDGLNILILIVGGPPAVALFAVNARYKRESYRGSEFAPAILANHSLKVVMKVRAPYISHPICIKTLSESLITPY